MKRLRPLFTSWNKAGAARPSGHDSHPNKKNLHVRFQSTASAAAPDTTTTPTDSSSSPAAPPVVSSDTNANRPKPPLATTEARHQLTVEQVQKVDRLFHKILWLDIFQSSMFVEELNRRMGRHLTDKDRRQIVKIVEADTRIMEGEDPAADAESSGSSDGDAAASAQAEPQLVELKLTGFEAKSKIKVIKEVRSMAGLGLKEAKELVEGLPKIVKKDLKPDQANELKAKLEAVGATVELA